MAMVYCRGCAKEIHESALACPQCGAKQNVEQNTSASNVTNGESTYSQVPWFRKRWFLWVSFFFLTPAVPILFLTGNFYYNNNGVATPYSKKQRLTWLVFSSLYIISGIVKYVKGL